MLTNRCDGRDLFFLDLIDRLNFHQISIPKQIIEIESHKIDNFDLNELMDLAEAYVVLVIDAIYCRLMERDFALENPEVVMLLATPNEYLGA